MVLMNDYTKNISNDLLAPGSVDIERGRNELLTKRFKRGCHTFDKNDNRVV